jgi:hypothetical protein
MYLKYSKLQMKYFRKNKEKDKSQQSDFSL